MIIKKSEARRKDLTPECTVVEYHFPTDSLSFATSRINGRLPAEGFSINEVCDELLFVLSGYGTASVGGRRYELSDGDCLFITRGTKYSIEGHDLCVAAPTAPRWYAEQHRTVSE